MVPFIWPIVFFGKVINHMGRYSRGWAIVCAFFAWLTGMIEVMFLAVMAQLNNLISSLSLSQFSNVNFSGVASVGTVNAIIPLSEMITVLIIYTTIWVTVILIRWIKSFVPTVAN